MGRKVVEVGAGVAVVVMAVGANVIGGSEMGDTATGTGVAVVVMAVGANVIGGSEMGDTATGTSEVGAAVVETGD